MWTASPTIVGRTQELALLDEALASVRRGFGRAVFILGDAGAGKSRLAGECAHRAQRAGLPTLRGRASATGLDMPLRPLGEALSSQLRSTGPPTSRELEPYRGALARLIPELRDGPGNHDAGDLVELSEAMLRLLAVLGRPRGCLVTLEDLHDADLETVAVVEYLVDNIADVPVLLVGTLRPEPGVALDLAGAAGQRRSAAVAELHPLDDLEVRLMAAGCLEVEPADVPAAVAHRLSRDSGGNPYLVEELLNAMIGAGALRRDGPCWRVVAELGTTVPATIIRRYAHQIARLGPRASQALVVAALLGDRFPLALVQIACGYDEQGLLELFQAATEAHLVVPEASGWYAFRHALTAQAVRTTLPAGELAAVARRAATAIERAEPTPADERCQLMARLYLSAGDSRAAGRWYGKAGRRALAAGATGSAAALLERGYELTVDADRTQIAESLLDALAEAGQLDRAFDLVESIVSADASVLSLDRKVALHTRLAWVALVAGRLADTQAQLATAHALLEAPTEEQRAGLAVVEAHLAFFVRDSAGRDRMVEAEQLARWAADVAERVPLPVVACQALVLLAQLARERGFGAAETVLARLLSVAEAHGLAVWRVEALLRLAGSESMRTGDGTRLEQARRAAVELGSTVLSHTAEGMVAVNAVLRADHAVAKEITGRCGEAAARLRHASNYQYLVLATAMSAAHQGRRREMRRALATFARSGGERSPLMPVALGLCRAVCALTEEDRSLAGAELAATLAWEDENPRSAYYLTGRHGLHVLLEVLAGRFGEAQYDAALASPAAGLRWNRQFLWFASAVLLGRCGRGADAAAACATAQAAATPFPMARHLGSRLVAEAALADGWGDPVTWLRDAEEYFHANDLSALAGACRRLLRQAGAAVAQRRDGRDQIPPELRAYGVTVREYEVFKLLAEAPGNQAIAQRLYISPRTVEKHVASLVAKTGQPGRAALGTYAATFAEVTTGR